MALARLASLATEVDLPLSLSPSLSLSLSRAAVPHPSLACARVCLERSARRALISHPRRRTPSSRLFLASAARHSHAPAVPPRPRAAAARRRNDDEQRDDDPTGRAFRARGRAHARRRGARAARALERELRRGRARHRRAARRPRRARAAERRRARAGVDVRRTPPARSSTRHHTSPTTPLSYLESVHETAAGARLPAPVISVPSIDRPTAGANVACSHSHARTRTASRRNISARARARDRARCGARRGARAFRSVARVRVVHDRAQEPRRDAVRPRFLLRGVLRRALVDRRLRRRVERGRGLSRPWRRRKPRRRRRRRRRRQRWKQSLALEQRGRRSDGADVPSRGRRGRTQQLPGMPRSRRRLASTIYIVCAPPPGSTYCFVCGYANLRGKCVHHPLRLASSIDLMVRETFTADGSTDSAPRCSCCGALWSSPSASVVLSRPWTAPAVQKIRRLHRTFCVAEGDCGFHVKFPT